MKINTNMQSLVDKAFLCVATSETNYDTSKWDHLLMANAGNSGWSFGPIQFDVSVSRYGRNILESLGVERHLILELASDTRTEPHENPKMIQAIRKVVNSRISENMSYVICESRNYITKHVCRILGLEGTDHLIVNESIMMFLLDYHTQFHLSTGGKCHKWLKSIEILTVEKFMDFKRTLPWNEKPEGKRDIDRRYNSVKRFCELKSIWASEIKIESEQIDGPPDWLPTDDDDFAWTV